jgi:hypothetical protein
VVDVVEDVDVVVDVDGMEDVVGEVDEAPERLHDFANVKRPVAVAAVPAITMPRIRVNHHGNPTLWKSIWIPPFEEN